MKLHRFPLAPTLLGLGFITVAVLSVVSLTSLPLSSQSASPAANSPASSLSAIVPSRLATADEAPAADVVSIELETASPDDLEAERDTVRARMSTLLARATQLRQQFRINDNDPDFPAAKTSFNKVDVFIDNPYTNLSVPVLVAGNSGTAQVSFEGSVATASTTGNSGAPAINGNTMIPYTIPSGDERRASIIDAYGNWDIEGYMKATDPSRLNLNGLSAGNTLILANQSTSANTTSAYQVLSNDVSGSVTMLSGGTIAQDQTVGARVQLLTAYFNTAAPDPVRGLQDYQAAKSDYLAAREQLAALEHRLQVSHLNPLPPERVKDWRRLPSLDAPSGMH